MGHPFKLLLAIINARIERKIDENQSETQYGFVTKKGSRDAIALLNVHSEDTERALSITKKHLIVSTMRGC